MGAHKSRVATMITVILLLPTLLGCAKVAETKEPAQKVAVLHIGPIEDYGWTYEAHLGAQKIAEELPYVELSEREEACGPWNFATKEVIWPMPRWEKRESRALIQRRGGSHRAYISLSKASSPDANPHAGVAVLSVPAAGSCHQDWHDRSADWRYI